MEHRTRRATSASPAGNIGIVSPRDFGDVTRSMSGGERRHGGGASKAAGGEVKKEAGGTVVVQPFVSAAEQVLRYRGNAFMGRRSTPMDERTTPSRVLFWRSAAPGGDGNTCDRRRAQTAGQTRAERGVGGNVTVGKVEGWGLGRADVFSQRGLGSGTIAMGASDSCGQAGATRHVLSSAPVVQSGSGGSVGGGARSKPASNRRAAHSAPAHLLGPGLNPHQRILSVERILRSSSCGSSSGDAGGSNARHVLLHGARDKGSVVGRTLRATNGGGRRRTTLADSGARIAKQYRQHQGTAGTVVHHVWSCHSDGGDGFGGGAAASGEEKENLAVIGGRGRGSADADASVTGPVRATQMTHLRRSASLAADDVGAQYDSSTAPESVEGISSSLIPVASSSGSSTPAARHASSSSRSLVPAVGSEFIAGTAGTSGTKDSGGLPYPFLDPSVLRAVRRGRRLVANLSGGGGRGHGGLLTSAEIRQELAQLTGTRWELQQAVDTVDKLLAAGGGCSSSEDGDGGGGDCGGRERVGGGAAGGATSAVSMLRKQHKQGQRPGTPNVTAGRAQYAEEQEQMLWESLQREREGVQGLLARLCEITDGKSRPFPAAEDSGTVPRGVRRPKHIATDSHNVELVKRAEEAAAAPTAATAALAAVAAIEGEEVAAVAVADDDDSDVDEAFDDPLFGDVRGAYFSDLCSSKCVGDPSWNALAIPSIPTTLAPTPPCNATATYATASMMSSPYPRKEYHGSPKRGSCFEIGPRPMSHPRTPVSSSHAHAHTHARAQQPRPHLHQRVTTGAPPLLDASEQLLVECQLFGLELGMHCDATVDHALSLFTQLPDYVEGDRRVGKKSGVEGGASGGGGGGGGVDSGGVEHCLPSPPKANRVVYFHMHGDGGGSRSTTPMPPASVSFPSSSSSRRG